MKEVSTDDASSRFIVRDLFSIYNKYVDFSAHVLDAQAAVCASSDTSSHDTVFGRSLAAFTLGAVNSSTVKSVREQYLRFEPRRQSGL